MAPKGVEIPRFGGLDLRDDPQEVSLGAALDGLNVDMSLPGRLKARGGYAKFTDRCGGCPVLLVVDAVLPDVVRRVASWLVGDGPRARRAHANSVLQVLDTNGCRRCIPERS
jgi:hypothetical protein